MKKADKNIVMSELRHIIVTYDGCEKCWVVWDKSEDNIIISYIGRVNPANLAPEDKDGEVLSWNGKKKTNEELAAPSDW